MKRNMTLKLAVLLALAIANVALFGARDAFADARDDWGQCEHFTDHCHCVAPVTETNCSSDASCNWGICKPDQT